MTSADVWYSWRCSRQSRMRFRDRNRAPIRTCSAETVRYRTAEYKVLKLLVKYRVKGFGSYLCVLQALHTKQNFYFVIIMTYVKTRYFLWIRRWSSSLRRYFGRLRLVVPSVGKGMPILEGSLFIVFPCLICSQIYCLNLFRPKHISTASYPREEEVCWKSSENLYRTASYCFLLRYLTMLSQLQSSCDVELEGDWEY